MKITPSVVAALILSFFAATSTCSVRADESSLHTWQIQRLLQPGTHAKQREQRGLIMIYSNLTDFEVAYALDTQFTRIQNFMFTNTIITGASGKPERDPYSGDMLFEEDDCD